jgi:hypothetical protein
MLAGWQIVQLSPLLIMLMLAGCSHTSQTTSGTAYIAPLPQIAVSDNGFEAKLRATASVDPLLRFPARIGLARIERNGCRSTLVPPPAEEGRAWLAVAQTLGPDYGEFVPISP